ncbi:hypothetical protein AB0L70_13350 [Kribbella sp. NPDC051952]|uniref:hypothetical protein n=1 Tax=Kribbella sp. NPDC051952 TaxID=3154851 RepID=UPI00342110A9
MGSTDQRCLSRVERALLDDLLAHDFAGVEPLREQARNVLAGKGCDCGCGTINLTPQDRDAPRSTSSSPAEVEGRVLGADGVDIGGLLLFVRDGLLSSLEVYSYDEPLPLPEPRQVIWQNVPRRR